MMKSRQTKLSFVSIVALSLLMGCKSRLPGQPTEVERWRPPAEISDFNQLYSQNCAGCHGVGGEHGAARSLNDPLYQAFVTDDALRQVISQGRAGTNMPAFSQQAGGALTDRQIELLIPGMRAKWSRPDDLKGIEVPPYSVSRTVSNGNVNAANAGSAKASPSGDSLQGAAVYQTYCARCHGPNGAGGPAGSIIDPNFLNLVSDQGLRTTVVVGRSDLGKPDWRSDLPGHPMSPQEIDALVAWLSAQRQTTSPEGESARLNPE